MQPTISPSSRQSCRITLQPASTAYSIRSTGNESAHKPVRCAGLSISTGCIRFNFDLALTGLQGISRNARANGISSGLDRESGQRRTTDGRTRCYHHSTGGVLDVPLHCSRRGNHTFFALANGSAENSRNRCKCVTRVLTVCRRDFSSLSKLGRSPRQQARMHRRARDFPQKRGTGCLS
jgi:hypothetical protein